MRPACVPKGRRVVITPVTIGRLRPRKKIVPGLPQISAISKNSAVETTGPGNCSAKHLDGDRKILSGKTIDFPGERDESSMEGGKSFGKRRTYNCLETRWKLSCNKSRIATNCVEILRRSSIFSNLDFLIVDFLV